MTGGSVPGLAVHVGADLLAGPYPRHWAPPRGCHDTITRMTRLCTAAGIHRQHHLSGHDATRDNLATAITDAARALDRRGLLVVTFSGHSRRDPGDTAWCLYDGTFGFAELARSLATLPRTARVVVVADTCYAAALARHSRWPCTLVLLAACDHYQTVLSGPASDFVVRLERLVAPGGVVNPWCTSYAWLGRQLQRDTPDAERPQIWTTHPSSWAHRPFDVLPPPRAE